MTVFSFCNPPTHMQCLEREPPTWPLSHLPRPLVQQATATMPSQIPYRITHPIPSRIRFEWLKMSSLLSFSLGIAVCQRCYRCCASSCAIVGLHKVLHHQIDHRLD